MRHICAGLIALMLPFMTAMGFTVSGNVSGASGFSLVFVYTIPTSLDTFYVAIANPFNGNYSQGNLDEGGYTLMAFQDLNLNLIPDLDDPRGFYGGDIPTVLQVSSDMADIDIELSPPNTGGFSGTVSYEGTETGTTLIFAHRTSTFEGLPNGAGFLLTNTGNGDYTAVIDSFGVYYAYAYMDVNTNFQFDVGEPYDVYGDDAEPEPINVEQGEPYPDGIDFELVATSMTPPLRVISDFHLGHAYPNPFNAATTIPFSLDRQMEVEILAHDMLGRTVATLASGSYPAGEHSVKFGNGSLASGVYVIELRAHGVSSCSPAILLK